MRHTRTALGIIAAIILTGCVATPRPAKTEITPGESEIISEREERRPSESTMRIRATVPPIRIRVVMPRDNQEE